MWSPWPSSTATPSGCSSSAPSPTPRVCTSCREEKRRSGEEPFGCGGVVCVSHIGSVRVPHHGDSGLGSRAHWEQPCERWDVFYRDHESRQFCWCPRRDLLTPEPLIALGRARGESIHICLLACAAYNCIGCARLHSRATALRNLHAPRYARTP